MMDPKIHVAPEIGTCPMCEPEVTIGPKGRFVESLVMKQLRAAAGATHPYRDRCPCDECKAAFARMEP